MSDNSAYLGMFLRVFDDLVGLSPVYNCKESSKDRGVVLDRYRSEGLAFLTKTLPSLAKALEAALESGTFTPVSGFARESGRTTPKFLRALFKEVFRENGCLLDNPCATSIGQIRQVCYFMYKFDADYPPELVDEVVNNFVSVDESLTHCEDFCREQRLYLKIATRVVGDVFRDLDPYDVTPRPGPGASASGSHRSERYEPLTWFRQVHEVYPYYRHFYLSTSHLLDRVRDYRKLPRKEYPVSVLRTVAKDSRGPRIICMEEQELMFLQQGLADKMRDHIELHPLTRGQVNFRDQTVNRRLAEASSVTRDYATLDMKEASDRISRKLVAEIFSAIPDMRRCLEALSTPAVRLPDGREVKLKKFAPMGSSLCFPTMSIVHFALAVAVLHVQTARPIKALAKEIYVYGDDIIVPSPYARHLFEKFPLFGLMFNVGKSFSRGYFRESCGMDAFQGRDVTPQRLKKRFFDGRDPRHIAAVMDMHLHLYERGYKGVASMLRTITDARFGKFPDVGKHSAFLGWKTGTADLFNRVSRTSSFSRFAPDSEGVVEVKGQQRINSSLPVWDSDTQVWTVSERVMETAPDSSMSGGWEQLMRVLCTRTRSSARLDDRFTRKLISYERRNVADLDSQGSRWLPPHPRL